LFASHIARCRLIEHLNNTWLKQVAELRDLSRPTRKKSHFPTFKALNNVRERMLEIDLNTAALVDYLQQELEEIAEHARRERAIRR
jgi:hypothetical protein